MSDHNHASEEWKAKVIQNVTDLLSQDDAPQCAVVAVPVAMQGLELASATTIGLSQVNGFELCAMVPESSDDSERLLNRIVETTLESGEISVSKVYTTQYQNADLFWKFKMISVSPASKTLLFPFLMEFIDRLPVFRLYQAVLTTKTGVALRGQLIPN